MTSMSEETNFKSSAEKLDETHVTPEDVFLQRRLLMKSSLIFGLLSLAPLAVYAQKKLFPAVSNKKYPAGDLEITKENVATSYNNFYEFSLEKDEVQKKVEKWTPASPWAVEVSGLVEKPRSYTLDELISLAGGSLEERIYRFRCVEAWSMVVPWTGFSLASLIEKLQPKKSAKYVKFVTFGDKKIGPNIAALPHYPWPYTEGLTMEEALHPLTMLATGMYGKPLPKQNGAPVRLVVPWKYGFKSIKSIVKIEFTDSQPKTLWNALAPDEYGFFANVNPAVSHPRWSQATERILDNSFFPKRKPTLLFNGYEKEVASLYKGLDLTKNF